MIALVISIIVMLILAGVSLNATIGENGIVTRAQEAKLAQEDATRREELEMILYKYNSSKFLGEEDGFTKYLGELKANGEIEDYIYFEDSIIIKYDGYYYKIKNNGEYYAIAEKMTEDLASSGGASKIVTPDNIENAEDGNIKFEDGDEFVILDNVSVDNFNFIIPSGTKVTIKLLGDMKIDNKKTSGKSAIDLGVDKAKDENGIWQYSNGATLNLYVYGNVEVNSSFGEPGQTSQSASTTAAKGGPGANARNSCSRNSNS